LTQLACTSETRRCPPHVQKAGAECCRQHLRRLVVQVGKEIEAAGLRYWLDFGTLLGAYRDRDICPGDTDIDICAFESDRIRLREIASRLASHGFVYRDQRTVSKVFLSGTNTLHVDIWFFKVESGVLLSTYHPKLDFLQSNIEPIGAIECWGHRFPAPNRVSEFLEYRYGPSFMTPERGRKCVVRRTRHNGLELR
jgi:phosphorylcholine metabolism protein LicD